MLPGRSIRLWNETRHVEMGQDEVNDRARLKEGLE